VLLALNPYKRIDGLYEEAQMDAYRGRALGVLPPHVFAIAERARRAMALDHTDQSIVVSGESGAGKTESCRAIVQYLAHHSRHEAGSLASALLAANPVLEAFGCAATTRNTNSSRFGKLMKIWTAKDSSALNGSSVVTYLLEKARVSHLGAHEQNFHAFYYLAAAAAAAAAAAPAACAANADAAGAAAINDVIAVAIDGEALGWLREAAASGHAFRYLETSTADDATAGDAPTVRLLSPGSERSAAWASQLGAVDAALRALGASNGEVREAWAVLGAVIALGEVLFEDEGEDKGSLGTNAAAADEATGHAAIRAGSAPALAACAMCLGVGVDTLQQRLLTRNVVSPRGSSYLIHRSAGAASSCRDGLAHELYDRLFTWVVGVVNRSLSGTESGGAAESAAAGARSIAILDIFGFESLACNSLEQLLINHTNERLQLYFLHQTLHAELALYAAEAVPAPAITLSDNAQCVALVEGKPGGLIWLLEDECDLQRRAKPDAANPGDANLVARAFKAHESHPNLQKPTRPLGKQQPAAAGLGAAGGATPRASGVAPSARFAIAHFAGTVEYDSSGFISKNSDALHPELPALLAASRVSLVAKLFNTEAAEPAADADENAPPPTPTRGGDAVPPPPPPPPKGRRRGSTAAPRGKASGKVRGVAGSFARQLDSLMSMLGQTTPHYVRCIKPNTTQQAARFEAALTLQQLRCGGTPQLLMLMGRGFPTRVEYEALAGRYQPRLPALAHAALTPREFAQALLGSLGLVEAKTGGAGDFALGVRRAFFSAGAMATLDRLMHGSEDELAEVVGKVMSYVRRRRWRASVAAVRALIKIGRRVIARRHLGRLALRARAFIAIREAVCFRWAPMAMAAVRAKHAAAAMQSVVRGRSVRAQLSRERAAARLLQARARLLAHRRALVARRAAEASAVLVLQSAARALAARREAAQLAEEKAEAERLLAEEKAEAERRAAEEKAEAERLAVEAAAAAEAEHQAAEVARVAELKRQEASRAEALTDSAIVLQSHMRALGGRRVAATRRAAVADEKAEKQRRLVAARAQREAKGQAKAERAACVRLQCVWRAALARKALSALRAVAASKREAAAAARKERARQVHRLLAVVKVQTAVRGALARKHYSMKRASLEGRTNAAVKQREAAARALASQMHRTGAATKLEAGARGLKARLSARRLREERRKTRERERAAYDRHTRATIALIATNAGAGGCGTGSTGGSGMRSGMRVGGYFAAMPAELAAMVAAMRLQGRWRRLLAVRVELPVPCAACKCSSRRPLPTGTRGAARARGEGDDGREDGEDGAGEAGVGREDARGGAACTGALDGLSDGLSDGLPDGLPDGLYVGPVIAL
jgi:hypothetical protein